MCCKQSFEHESRFNQISAIIFTAETKGLTGFSVHPVWPYSVKTISFFIEKSQDFQHPFNAFVPCNEFAFDSHNNCHYAKPRATGSNYFSFGCRIASFVCQTAYRMGKIPEIAECLFLD